MPDSNLTIHAKLDGAAATAAGLQQLTAAQKDAAATSGEVAAKTEDATASQEDANVALQDLVGLVSRIDPRIGTLIGRLLRLGGALGSAGLTDIVKSATAGLLKYADALKLLGAAGFAMVGIGAAIKAVQKLREETERLKKAMEDLSEARTGKAREAMERGEAAVAEADTFKRIPPKSDEQLQSIIQTIAAAPDDLKEKFDKLASVFGGATGFGPAPGAFSGRELERMARGGFEADTEKSLESNERRARKFLEKEAADSEVIERRRRLERERETREAEKELQMGTGGAKPNLDRIVEEQAKAFGADPKELKRAVIEEFDTKKIERADALREQAARYRAEAESRDPNRPGEGLVIRAHEAGAARLEREAEKLEGLPSTRIGTGLGMLGSKFIAPRDPINDMGPNQIGSLDEIVRRIQPTVIQNNGRYIGRDAAAKAARSTNGEKELQKLEP